MIKKKVSKENTKVGGSELNKLKAKLARLEKKCTKLALEKNFLERAMGDLNFHDNAHDGVVYTDPEGRIIYANPYFLKMMGVKKKGELLNKPFPNYMWNSQREADRLFMDISKDGFVREREMALYNKDKQPVFAMCSGVASKDEDGNSIGAEIMFCNITSKRAFQVELVEQNALLDAMLQSTPDPVIVLSSALDVKRSNPAAQQLFGIGQAQTAGSFASLLAKGNLASEAVQRIEAKFLEDRPFEVELDIAGQDFDMRAAPLNSQQKGWVCTLHNITVRKQTQEMLQQHAFHDALTRLPNRAYLLDFLQRANLRAKTEPDYRFAILFIDLDDLKSANDTMGHHIGDELLTQFSQRIASSIRPDDLVARLGGDEFAVFVDKVDGAAKARQVAARIQKAIARPYKLNEIEGVRATASIGIALSGQFPSEAEVLLRNADKAMYRVKQRGGDNYEIFDHKTLAEAGATTEP